MSKVKLVLILAAVAFVVMAGEQVVVAEWKNWEFQDELHDLASLLGQRIGLTDLQSDDNLRNAVVVKAARLGIQLSPTQVIVQRSGSKQAPVVHLAADYDASIELPKYSFTLHFTPSSTTRSF
jgi:hypothetical protein